jgi:hypothetical protein
MTQPETITDLRTRRDAALTVAIAANERGRALDAAISQAQRAGESDAVTKLEAERADATRAGEAAGAEHTRLAGEALSGLVEWVRQSPEDTVATCSDQLPFVLLPVRMETKFARVGDSTELRVRLFPDDIGIAPPLAAVSDTERDLGEAYWRARADSKHDPANTDLRGAYEGAWNALAAAAGAYRASYIVRATTPANPDAASSDLQFSDPAPPQTPPVPRAELLPDRFVVLTYAANAADGSLREVSRAVGAAIPDDLVVGPDPSLQDSWLTRDPATGRIVVPGALEWMVDFDAAVSVGMAVRIPLSPPHDTAGFDRVLAVGVRAATPAAQGPAAVESLLAKHRFGDGCAVARAGTPTNNTDTATSGWRPPAGDAQELFAIEDAPPNIAPGAGGLGIADGWRLATLLGLSTDFANRLPGATATDISEALAMNQALAPGTLDEFVSEFLQGLVGAAAGADLHRFFTAWVSGRGHYPALRVGRQPYGVVVTSDWKSWAPAPAGTPLVPQQGIVTGVQTLLLQHRPYWEALARGVPHAAQTGGDPFQRLLDIIGLLASSSDYVSRKAVSDEYVRERLSFGGANAAAIQAWFNALASARGQSLNAIHFPPAPGPTDPLLAFIVFMRDTSEWRQPLVDRDPTVPLSETNAIAPYDGVRNYLHWLAEASRDDLRNQHFIGADGTSIAPPAALLYLLLRHAYLTALEHSSLLTAGTYGGAFFDVIARDPLIANIGSEQHILRRDYLEVDASRLGLASRATPLADWVLSTARSDAAVKPAPVQYAAEAHAAITALADLPTARLERLMAEHVDLCSYRIDSWITALYAQRLAALRSNRAAQGLYLGAFGWLENVRPATATRQRVSAESLPAALRSDAGADVFEDTANGGYIHAPSLPQAATAAVLRNGYLSHADSTAPQTFAINLSSARTRAAVALMQGVRSGQSIAALLGYQFERGLHEGHPGVELDQYIAVLRDRFPLVAGRLTDLSPGVSIDSVEARNVVDGLALVEATGGAYPYGISGLPAAGSTEALAVTAEIDRAHDALDAVSDLLLAESVHQATQGNLDRTQSALQALTSPGTPPEPEIIRTPRSGRALTFRALLALDPDATGGWTAALSPRARANPQLNHWLSRHLPAPAAVQWTVRNGNAAPSAQSFAGLGLEPIDIVLMSGNTLGDQSSELERGLIRQFRWVNAVPDDRATVVAPASPPPDPATTTLFDFSAASAGSVSLSRLQPLLARLRRLITQGRPSDAADWRRAADRPASANADPTGSASGDPKLDDFKDLTDRIDAAANDLTVAGKALKDALAALASLRAAFDADPGTAADPGWPAALDSVRAALFALAPFGMPEAVPVDGLTVSPSLIDTLLRQADAVVVVVDAHLASASALRTTSFTDPLPSGEPERTNEIARRRGVLRQNYMDAAKSLLGANFLIVPLFKSDPAQASELQQALATPVAGDAMAVEEWLHSAARVRPRLADLTWAMAGARWIDRAIGDPVVAQLPYQAGAPWIGGTFTSDLPLGEWLSLLIVGVATAGGLQAGIVIDDWTETVPADQETTGIAFNFNRPNAIAPQAVLVAVAPVLRGHWTWDELVGSVHEALDLAKLRAVEPDRLFGRAPTGPASAGAYFQALPAILMEFTQGRLAVTDFAAQAVVAAQART